MVRKQKQLEFRLLMTEALKRLGRRKHFSCEDPYYSCPKAPECSPYDDHSKCKCGADKQNAYVAKLLKKLNEETCK